MTDVLITNHGSIVGFHLKTKAARDWVDENVAHEGWQWMGEALCVETRFADNLRAGMEDAGLVVE